ncbi:OmpA family protein [Marivibrio halodurans]|uniref:OmpA family protein n=1 Tax=Marivibrio halodurans TaxID=2039722 RepID=A0A8J7V1X7_9PROT|nr:flagellar motor protein MotB [Marivibrio halodurans]MBP5856800.1 OmpA family protein [Marivibrio halodurans]
MAAKQEVIVKKKKVVIEGHHGGAWKVAYADFVTAMMAFFLLLWLLNATEQEVLDGISNYFTPTVLTQSGSSGAGGLFGGASATNPGPVEQDQETSILTEDSTATGQLNANDPGEGANDETSTGSEGEVDFEAEEKTFNTTKNLIEKSLDEMPPELQDLKESIKVDITEDGLRIQVLDNRRRSGFVRGTSELTENARQALRFVSQYIERLPNRISITGYTDAEEAPREAWQLSAARANSARRILRETGLPPQKFETVQGKAATELLVPEEPTSALNRRISIVMLRRAEYPDGVARPPSILDTGDGQTAE